MVAMAEEPIIKSFTDWLWEREDALEKGSSSRNRIEFMRAKDDIKTALEEGWSGRMIWERLRAEGRIRFGHSAFAKYVRTQIQGKPALGTPRSITKPTATAQPPAVATRSDPQHAMDRTFRITRTPRKEDLL